MNSLTFRSIQLASNFGVFFFKSLKKLILNTFFPTTNQKHDFRANLQSHYVKYSNDIHLKNKVN